VEWARAGISWVFPVRAGQLLNYVGFVSSDTAVRESWSAPATPRRSPRTSLAGTSVIGQVIAEISGPGGSGFQRGMYDRVLPYTRWEPAGGLTLLGRRGAPDAAAPWARASTTALLEEQWRWATLSWGLAQARPVVPGALSAVRVGCDDDRTARRPSWAHGGKAPVYDKLRQASW